MGPVAVTESCRITKECLLSEQHSWRCFSSRKISREARLLLPSCRQATALLKQLGTCQGLG